MMEGSLPPQPDPRVEAAARELYEFWYPGGPFDATDTAEQRQCRENAIEAAEVATAGLRERETVLAAENKTLREARDRGDAVHASLERLFADVSTEAERLTERETALAAALRELVEKCERGSDVRGNCVVRLVDLEAPQELLNDNA